ncbi:MAG: 2OG-Fe(II) oxygenase [Bdellovibrionales bacterium]|nr:2OG-Fe(II) oxygenase [Bdellovibrionales bacterium]
MMEQIAQEIHQQGWSYQQLVVDNLRLKSLDHLFATDFRPAQVGSDSRRQRAEAIRGDWTRWLDPQNPPTELIPEMQFLRELMQEFNRKFYMGLKDFECHLAKYPPGSFYKKHLDRFEKDSSRSISFVFYLHEAWEKNDGGELVLYTQQDEIIKTILPEPGSMIVFLSDEFPHEVKISSKERRSLTGWMHTKILT